MFFRILGSMLLLGAGRIVSYAGYQIIKTLIK